MSAVKTGILTPFAIPETRLPHNLSFQWRILVAEKTIVNMKVCRGCDDMECHSKKTNLLQFLIKLNPLTPDLNPSAQRCLTRFFTGDFAS
jgi:hypothetical protein